jgi:hypothetical protein
MTKNKWFINECLEVYPYDPAKQQDDFPNDFPLAFETEDEAEAEADAMAQWEAANAERERASL